MIDRTVYRQTRWYRWRCVGKVARSWACAWFLVVGYGLGVAPTEASEYLVSDRATNQILRFDSETGAALGPLVDNNMATNGGLFAPTSLGYGFQGDLYVASIDLNTGAGKVLRYDADSGAYLGDFASGLVTPSGILYHRASNTMLVGSLGPNLGDSNVISRYRADGSALPSIVEGAITGRTDITLGADGRLYVSSFAEGPFFSGSVLTYDYDAGQDSFHLSGPFAQAPQLAGANGSTFDVDGDLYVASLFGQAAVRFDVEQGAVVASGVIAQVPYPSDVLIDDLGNLLITSLGNNNPNDPIYPNTFPGLVFRFDRDSGAPVGTGQFLLSGNEFQPTSIVRRSPRGDYDFDGRLDADDIDQLQQAIRKGTFEKRYDVNGTSTVDTNDVTAWLRDVRHTYVGDANLDGEFNSDDLIVVFSAGEYEDGQVLNSTWVEGDWTSDGEFDSSDLVAAFADGGYERGPQAAVAIPEPTGVVSLLIGCGAAGHALRRRRV